MYLLAILLLPLLIPVIGKVGFSAKISWREFAIHVAIVSVVLWGGYEASRYFDAKDTQILNGQVIGKSRDRVHCRHSYQCHCVRVSCGKNCSTTSCQTCYEHGYDIDWNVSTSVGGLSINTIDRQGLNEPPRWSAVSVGEPAAREASYVNYVRAVPDSIFHKAITDRGVVAPAYPTVSDYYRVQRVINVGAGLPQAVQSHLNAELNMRLRQLGPTRQVNVVILIGRDIGPRYAAAIRQQWYGGKKNDVIVVAKLSGDRIVWAESFGWSKQDMVFVKIRDNLLALPSITGPAMADAIAAPIASDYVRIPMSDFEYLADEMVPPTWALWTLAVIGLLLSGGLFYVFHKEEF